ncbi:MULTISPECIES: hypothetical protein [unclassified Bradyrhizobium]|jgi:hypothetical protein|uniref:hypothetical protein n=1 Tax=unclassified Bradyrhizobium TaxID=2631580 RepID=UPI0023AE7521|nr:hypothetical protein [Bradyrhizobium sp. CSS354]MDE5459511.1 hypothetical protein [Bradyrhizobium sp. CSS354]
MPQTWYVTFEVQKRGTLPKRRSPRETRTFESEAEARAFAREKFNEGLIVFAGTLNPFLPRRLIPSSDIPSWIEQDQGDEVAGQDAKRDPEK